MTFRDFDIQISYTGSSYAKIINPLLSCTKIYRRNAGFFSSSVFDFIFDGVTNMAKNGGKIYLATSPRLSNRDIDAISKGYKDKELMVQSVMPELYSILDSMSDDNVKLLYTLVKDGVLDIKIVLPKYGMYDYGIYHDKLAFLEDYDGNIVICSGSANETGTAYSGVNYERMRVYTSWDDSEKRIDDETSEFLKIWDNTNEDLIVYDFNSALEKNLVERVNKEGRYKKHDSITEKGKDAPITMRDYQIDAKNNWLKNGHKGFFVMATGTGKTYTALYSIKDFINSNKIFTVIVVPYKHLARQWVDDINFFIPEATVIEVHGEIKDAETRIFLNYRAATKVYKPIIVVSTVNSFCLERYMNLFDSVKFEKLLIVDEAHNFYNKLNDSLSIKYPYKIGLSATPIMGNDADKTSELLQWFGGKVIDLPIKDAIAEHFLVNYMYHPIFVNATEDDEEKFNKGTTIMASAMLNDGSIIDVDKFLKGRRMRLRAISLAEEKIQTLPAIFSKIKEKDHTIIYCSDGRLMDEGGKLGSDKEIRHLEYVLNLINNSCLLDTDVGKASKFTASEKVDERMELIDSFNKGYIEYLVAIRCLDEGINIPSIKAALILSSNDSYREFVQRRGRILRLYEGKDIAHIYDVIVLPSTCNTKFAEVEFRRYYEYSDLALNRDELLFDLNFYLNEYHLKIDDIMFSNEYIYGGDLDD